MENPRCLRTFLILIIVNSLVFELTLAQKSVIGNLKSQDDVVVKSLGGLVHGYDDKLFKKKFLKLNIVMVTFLRLGYDDVTGFFIQLEFVISIVFSDTQFWYSM